MSNSIKIFSGEATRYLAEKISLAYDGKKLNEMVLTKFADGEFQPSFNESIRGENVFLISSCFMPTENFFELLMMIDAAKRASAKQIIAVAPFLCFCRGDKKDKPRVPISAKLVADMLQVAGISRLVTVDLHTDAIAGFYNCPVDALNSAYIFIPHIKSLNLENLVIAAPDAGAAKKSKIFADALGVEMVICYKNRSGPNKIEEIKLLGDVKDKNVIIVDDLTDTCGTLIKSAEIMMKSGAKSIKAAITHSVMSGNSYSNLGNSCIDELITTDTIPIKVRIENNEEFNKGLDKITVLSTDEMFASVIRRIKNNESISSHFNVLNQQ